MPTGVLVTVAGGNCLLNDGHYTVTSLSHLLPRKPSELLRGGRSLRAGLAPGGVAAEGGSPAPRSRSDAEKQPGIVSAREDRIELEPTWA